jgi:CHAT domain-containing protein/tetratricopeptide (TPR) repeat protein
MTRVTQSVQGQWATGRILALFCLVTSLAAPLAGGEPPPADAARRAEFQERGRLWQQAQQLRAAGKTAEAIAAGEAMLAIERKLYPQPAEDFAISLDWLGDAELGRESFPQAEKRFREALDIRTAVFGAEHWKVTDARLKVERAQLLARLSPQDRQDLRAADAADSQRYALERAGKYSAAIAPAEKCRDIRLRILGAADRDSAWAVDRLATMHQYSGDLARAVPLFLQALEIRKAALGEKHPGYASSLNNLAELYRAMGDYARAEPLYRQALDIDKAALGEKHPDYATDLNNLASLYDSMGDYARAEPLYRQALEIKKGALGDKHPSYATSLNNLAELYRSMGDYARAEPLYRQALEIKKAALGDKHPSYASGLNNLAMLYDSMGDYAQAEPLYRQALEIKKGALGDKHPSYATSLNNLAELYRSMGDYARAEPLYRQALEIDKAALGDKHPGFATDLNNLALLYDSMGDYARAEPLYRQASDIDKTALGNKHPHYATSLNNLAELYRSMGDYARAEPLYRQALEIDKAALGDKHPGYAIHLNNLAVLELALGRPGEAEKHAKQAVAIQRQSLDLAGAVQSERQQLAMTGGVRFYLDSYLAAALAAGTPPGDIYAEAAAWKGAVSAQQQQMRAREHALAADPKSEFARLFAQLDQHSRKLAALYRYTPKPEEAEKFRQATRTLAESVEALQQQLSGLDPDFHRAWAERSLSSDTLRKALPAGAALVDLLEYDHYIPPPMPGEKQRWERRYLAFVLRNDRPVACTPLGPAAPINELVETWRAGFGRLPTAAGKLPGDELGKLVWQPLAAELAGVKIVLISPDGALAQLPWAALPGEKPGTFLIEQRQLAVVPVPQMLPELLKATPPPGAPASLFLAGDIDYGGDPGTSTDKLASRAAAARRRDGSVQFVGLEAAQGELASIRDWYEQAAGAGDVKALRRRNATESAFRDQAPRHPWLHLITHGYFASGQPSDSQKREPTDPGLLSGLAFAGANRPPADGKDDGILTALEVAALDLSKVDTVVLSACETGLGQSAGGEGLLGLQRAFQVAGAKTVVASLWKVPDAATSRLMQRFYKNMWDRKLGRLAALQEAQVFMIHDQASRGLVPEHREADDSLLPPQYWAAFALSGDWR